MTDYSVKEYLDFYLQPIFYFFSSKDPSKNNYYDRVYLCIEKENSKKNNKIKGFHCYQCKNIEEAKSEYYKKFSEKNHRSAIIPICKYVPMYFDPNIVNYKLKNLIWIGNHTFYRKSSPN